MRGVMTGQAIRIGSKTWIAGIGKRTCAIFEGYTGCDALERFVVNPAWLGCDCRAKKGPAIGRALQTILSLTNNVADQDDFASLAI